MAVAELALSSLFYLYPFLVTLTLVAAQCLLFYLNRRREAARAANPSSADDVHDSKQPQTDRTQRNCAWLIWSFQLLLCGLLIASISLTVNEALADHGDTPGSAAFPFSAYLVSALNGLNIKKAVL